MDNYSNIPVSLEKTGTEEYILNMGPQHPSTHGVLRLVLKLDGETIKDIVPDLGYVHRGLEKLFENRTYGQIIPYLDRTDYLSAMNNEWAYVMAVEKLMGIEAPERAQYMRVIFAELNRIMSHLLWYSAYGMDIGALTPLLYAFREREEIIDMVEAACGGRLTHNYYRIGGFRQDLPKGFFDMLKKFISHFKDKVDEYEALLINNVIFVKRAQGVGVLKKDTAINYGVTGPNLRASGVNIDIRKQDAYGVYGKLDFKACLRDNGDTWDRCKARMAEMRECVTILKQAMDMIPEGDVMAKVPRIIKPAAGEVYTRVEGPKGEVGVYIVSDGTDKPYRMKLRQPSFSNLSVIKEISVGHKIADLVAIMGSLDIIIPEIDR
ncbi:MAG: NADH-quinone oxidoreductase subunit NuoD [Candidatus Goldiibacteriota bacterium HGW-Goldbacteria-1]|jgi:NADH-quinone oxidoreductase subunit D|nr:MAG: NADH-quinone oxidoreductase subunit NuoD [Candidatus Goldiibacteriota bacterium HGW-Goldbacteria-1]